MVQLYSIYWQENPSSAMSSQSITGVVSQFLQANANRL
jgi:hypothetical protein